MNSLRRWAKAWKLKTIALYFACRDPRLPWYTKTLAFAVVAYAFSPIDLIPDFIPILGLLDDVILVPLGIAIVVKLIPSSIMQECEQKAEAFNQRKPKNWIAAVVIVTVWILMAALVCYGLTKWLL